MAVTFETLLENAEKANSFEALYASVKEANEKLHRNLGKLEFAAAMNHGGAIDAQHYYENVVPEWKQKVARINTIWTNSVSGKSTEEIVAIMTGA